MLDQLVIAFLIGASVVAGFLYVGFQLHLQDEQDLNAAQPQLPSHPPSSPVLPPRQLLTPTPEERLAARQQSIDLAIRSLDTKTRDIKVYLTTKELSRQTQRLHRAKTEQEYWTQYDVAKRRTALPDPRDLLRWTFER